MSRRVLILAVPLLLLAALGLFAWSAAIPCTDPQPLPTALVDLGTSAGQALLAEAKDASDSSALAASFQPQWLKRHCGVAVLAAMGLETTQQGFFDAEAQDAEARSARARWQVMLAGMALDDPGGLLAAHEASVRVRHADTFDAAAFREAVARNLSRPGDDLVVNHDRAALGQDGSGYISPLAAYDGETDMVLVMDTAAHKDPQTWAPLDLLYAAMATEDAGALRVRGCVEVQEVAGD